MSAGLAAAAVAGAHIEVRAVHHDSICPRVALGLQARGVLNRQRPRVDEALARVGLGEFAKVHPHRLSGGRAQRADGRPHDRRPSRPP